MTTALEICQTAYRETNPGQDLTSFSQQDWPYSLAQGYLNDVISEMNVYKYYFMETDTLLPYSAGVSTYNLTQLGIEPNAITQVQIRSSDGVNTQVSWVHAMNYSDYTYHYPTSQLQSVAPSFYSVYGNTLYLNNAPQTDYKVHVYYLDNIPKVNAETDIFPVPFEYEHIFKKGVKCHLLMDLSRPDGTQKYQIWQKDIKDMAAKINISYNLPSQLPRSF